MPTFQELNDTYRDAVQARIDAGVDPALVAAAKAAIVKARADGAIYMWSRHAEVTGLDLITASAACNLASRELLGEAIAGFGL